MIWLSSIRERLMCRIVDYVISIVCWRRREFWSAKNWIVCKLVVEYN